MCHRYPVVQKGTSQTVDCTHWNDGVYSILAGLILEALETLDELEGSLSGNVPLG